MLTQPDTTSWFYACEVSDVPENGGVCVKYNTEQVALFHFARLNTWFATQNECPHKKEMALSRGMIGTQDDIPKVACPFHKRTFSLLDGTCFQGDTDSLKVYQVKVEGNKVYIRG